MNAVWGCRGSGAITTDVKYELDQVNDVKKMFLKRINW